MIQGLRVKVGGYPRDQAVHYTSRMLQVVHCQKYFGFHAGRLDLSKDRANLVLKRLDVFAPTDLFFVLTACVSSLALIAQCPGLKRTVYNLYYISMFHQSFIFFRGIPKVIVLISRTPTYKNEYIHTYIHTYIKRQLLAKGDYSKLSNRWTNILTIFCGIFIIFRLF